MRVPVTNDNPDYVIIAFDTQLDYEKLTLVRCVRWLPILPRIRISTVLPRMVYPDIGLHRLYQGQHRAQPDLIVGKPYGTIVDDVLAQTDHKPERWLVGDRLYTRSDRINHDIYSILVLTGETTQEMLDASDIRPDLVVDRLSSLIQWL